MGRKGLHEASSRGYACRRLSCSQFCGHGFEKGHRAVGLSLWKMLFMETTSGEGRGGVGGGGVLYNAICNPFVGVGLQRSFMQWVCRSAWVC